MRSIWFFVGLMLLVMGAIVAAGAWQLARPPAAPKCWPSTIRPLVGAGHDGVRRGVPVGGTAPDGRVRREPPPVAG